MQSLGFTPARQMIIGHALLLRVQPVHLYACPEDLDPKNVCVQSKPVARERGLFFKGTPESVTPHPMAEFRRVPMKRLIARLGLSEFNNVGPLTDMNSRPAG
jgi:hypothetical protein